MKKTRFTEPQIMAVLREAESGVAVPAVCRTHGITTASFYEWRSKYRGMDASMMSQMTTMEEDNRRPKRMFADLSMQADLLREALGMEGHPPLVRGNPDGNKAGSAPNVGRDGSGDTWCQHSAGMSVFWGQWTCFRYSPIREEENERIADLLVGLTKSRKTWGFGLCFLHLRNVRGGRHELPLDQGHGGRHGTINACAGSIASWN